MIDNENDDDQQTNNDDMPEFVVYYSTNDYNNKLQTLVIYTDDNKNTGDIDE